MSVLSSPHFHDEAKAFAFLESVVWAGGVTCPHCGVVGWSGVRSGWRSLQAVRSRTPKALSVTASKSAVSAAPQFTVKVGTVFEHARMPLHKMLQAVHLMVSQQEGHLALTSSAAC